MFGLFGKKKRTLLDEVNDLTVQMFRPLLVNNKKISDEKILEIVQTTMRAFKQAADSKGEVISGSSLIKISSKFILVYDMSGQELFLEHLKYEIKKYLTDGLRPDYQDNA